MRYWLVLGLLTSAVACSSDDGKTVGDTDQNADSDNPQFETATCQELYDRDDHCLSEAGCGGAFNESDFVQGCEGSSLSAEDLGEAASLACDDIMIDLCTSSAGLFSLACCRSYFTCPSALKCEPIDEDGTVGACVNNDDSFPTGAKTCKKSSDCGQAGFLCLEGSSSSKCVQICAP